MKDYSPTKDGIQPPSNHMPPGTQREPTQRITIAYISHPPHIVM